MQNIEKEASFKEALKKLKQSKAWRGTIDERINKFRALHNDLNAIYGLDIKLEFIDVSEQFNGTQGASCLSGYNSQTKTIYIVCKLSVITFIQMWLKVLEYDPIFIIDKSNELFKEIFPVSARNIVNINGLLVKTTDHSNDPNNDPVVSG